MEELSQKRAQVIKLEGKLGALKSRKDQMIEDKEKLESRINNLFHVCSVWFWLEPSLHSLLTNVEKSNLALQELQK